ncbi:hypothetical protein F2Q68_00007186 [Brassica cretica]|uniref:Uncharacterized protein n=1 Tax=Brassica cretica TaxID=69181 RepID=A0A8S9L1N1_BRACR|nr:hypothetical protein F2Q68_00007186 [Brassica cretica]
MERKKCVDLLGGENKKKVRWTTAEDLKLWSSSSHTWADMAAEVRKDDIKAVRVRKDHSKLNRMAQKLKKGKVQTGKDRTDFNLKKRNQGRWKRALLRGWKRSIWNKKGERRRR